MPDAPLDCLVGQELDTVSFVRDYVELRIDYSIVRALTAPTGSIGGIEWELYDEGAADLLRRYIGLTVSAAEVIDDERITLFFGGSDRIDVSLRPADHGGLEAAHFVPALPGGQLDLAGMWVW